MRDQNETNARTFSDYLYVQGIENQLEAENDGKWAVWVQSEEEIERAQRSSDQLPPLSFRSEIWK